MQFPHGLTLDQKFAYALALAQERRDARKATGTKPQCRDKPVVSRTGRVVKPATILCGSVCRQKRNCKITKAQLALVRRRMPGATNQEIAKALRTAMEKKRQGMGTAGALYEGTKGARGKRGREALERTRQKKSAPKQESALVKPPGAAHSVRLGKPLYQTVQTAEEAIASGRAILGDLIERMAAEAGGLASVGPVGVAKYRQDLQSDLDSLTGEYADTARRHMILQQKMQQAVSEGRKPMRVLQRKFEALDKEFKGQAARVIELQERIASIGKGTAKDPGLEAMPVHEINSHIASWELQVKRFKKSLKIIQQTTTDPKTLDSHKADIQTLTTNIQKAKEMLKARKAELGDAAPTAKAVIEALMEASPIDAEEARSLASQVLITGKVAPETRQRLADLVRLTNGQFLETMGEVKVSNARAHASRSRGYVTFKGDNFDTLFHEVGHHVEFGSGASAGIDFVKGRATGDAQKLSAITGNRGYRKHEIAVPDHFINPYVGKVYQDDSTEVISMGLQYFAEPALLAKLAQKDPEHLALVVGVIQQARRGQGADAAKAKQDKAVLKKQSKKVFQQFIKTAPQPISSEGNLREYETFRVESRQNFMRITGNSTGTMDIAIAKRYQPLFEAYLARNPMALADIKGSVDVKMAAMYLFEGILPNLDKYMGKDPESFKAPIVQSIMKFLADSNWDPQASLDNLDLPAIAAPRRDSLVREVLDRFSQNHFGLNPKPFHHPLWDSMGY